MSSNTEELLASFAGSRFQLERVLSEIASQEERGRNPEVAAAYSWALKNGLIRERVSHSTTDAGVQLLELMYVNG